MRPVGESRRLTVGGLEVCRVETETGEAQQGRIRLGECHATRRLDDLAEQDVAGVGVAEGGPRRCERGAEPDRELDLLEASPVVGRIGDDLRLVTLVGRVVRKPAGVEQQVAHGDPVHRVSAGGQGLEGLRQQMRGDGIVESDPAVLDESQHRGGGVRLGVARDAKGGVRLQRRAAAPVGDAGCDAGVDLPAWRREVQENAWNARRFGDRMFDRELEPGRSVGSGGAAVGAAVDDAAAAMGSLDPSSEQADVASNAAMTSTNPPPRPGRPVR